MVSRLSIFANEVQRVAKDVGVDGKMGGQADVAGIGGRWKEITTVGDSYLFCSALLTFKRT